MSMVIGQHKNFWLNPNPVYFGSEMWLKWQMTRTKIRILIKPKNLTLSKNLSGTIPQRHTAYTANWNKKERKKIFQKEQLLMSMKQGYYTKDIQRKILALKVSSRQDYVYKLDWFTSHFQNSLYFHLTFLKFFT